MRQRVIPNGSWWVGASWIGIQDRKVNRGPRRGILGLLILMAHGRMNIYLRKVQAREFLKALSFAIRTTPAT